MSNRFKGWEHVTAEQLGAGRSLPLVSSQKPTKFHNRKTVTPDGILCDSKAEASRWNELRAMRAAQLISDLLPHPSFPLYVNGKRTGRISFDSLYIDGGRLTCEDVKSAITQKQTAYRQRLKTFRACYPHIYVREEIR